MSLRVTVADAKLLRATAKAENKSLNHWMTGVLVDAAHDHAASTPPKENELG